MSKGQPVSVRLTPTLNEQVGALAAALDRPKSWIIEQAVEDYVALQTWHLAAIDEGIKAAEDGRVASHEDVEAWVRSWGSPAERPAPKCG
ncbi:CopG family ribbon-helix-helix protein [Humitalea rosea]|nr:CopG family ribbon-helix-helix protein [Humitalea rosea]